MRQGFSFSSQLVKMPPVTIIILTVFSIAISFAIVKGGLVIGLALVAGIAAIPPTIFLLTDIKFGFFSLLVASFFISFIHRLSEGLVPALVVEIMMLMVFTGFIIKQIRTNSRGISSEYLKNPITVAIVIWTIYTTLQLFNPNSSSTMGKLIAIRFSFYNLMGFILAIQVFDSIKRVRLFFKIVLVTSLLGAIYGLTQKYVGLLPYDHDWLFSSPQRMSLMVIWGNVRAWSFLNDPANFGILMAFSGLLCFSFMLGPYTVKRKMILCICGVIMFLAMVSSGTRTAFVMVPVGFGIFGLLTANNLKTILFSLFILMVFLTIYFGPFYNAPVQRIRSAFQGNDDPSMNVRSENRKRIQPYIWSHPIGGGPSTTGEEGKIMAPGHPLAGFPPDGGYLKIGLEFGYLGLMIILWQYFIASSRGIHRYFEVEDKEVKIFYIAILSSFIALCSANLTQLSSTMRPFDFFTFSYLAMLIKLSEFDKGLIVSGRF